MSIKALAHRLATIERTMRGPLQTFIFLQEVGSNAYTMSLDGSTRGRDFIDKLLAEGHRVVIRQLPQGWIV